jgi:hypothetical protein
MLVPAAVIVVNAHTQTEIPGENTIAGFFISARPRGLWFEFSGFNLYKIFKNVSEGIVGGDTPRAAHINMESRLSPWPTATPHREHRSPHECS